MSENIGTVAVDPLAMPASEIDTRFPRLQPDRVYRMIIRSPEKKTNDKGTEMLNVKLETTGELIDTDGKALHAGFKFTHRIVGATGERDLNSVAKDLAMLIKAVYGSKATQTPRAVWDNPADLDGKPVDVKVGIQKERDGFPESNVVKSWVLPA